MRRGTSSKGRESGKGEQADREGGGRTDRQTDGMVMDGHTEKGTDGQTERQAGRQTDRWWWDEPTERQKIEDQNRCVHSIPVVGPSPVIPRNSCGHMFVLLWIS